MITGALDEIDHATQRLRANADENLLRLKLPPTFAIRWLVPRLHRFQALHPQIEVKIVPRTCLPTSTARTSTSSSTPNTAGPRARAIGGCSGRSRCRFRKPGPAGRRPAAGASGGPAGHVLLCLAAPAARLVAVAGGGRGRDPGAQGPGHLDNAALAYQAAIDRLGVVIAQKALVEDDLKTGRLVALLFELELITNVAPTTWLFHPRRPQGPRAAAFEAWLLDEAAASEVSVERPAAWRCRTS